MTKGLTTQLRLMMNQPPMEQDLNYTNKEGKEISRVRESLEAFMLGTDTPLTTIDININKFVNGNQYRNVKLTDLFLAFMNNTKDLTSGKKVLLANIELIPQKNFYSEKDVINSFQPYLASYDIADANEEDKEEIESIKRITG
jgi:hypothetical protein